MRVLSLTQPWASLMAFGEKRYETRSWSTPYTGLVAIHAAKGFPRECMMLCKANEPFTGALVKHGATTLKPLVDAGGHIIAVVELVCCVRTRGEVPRKPDGLFSQSVPPAEHEASFGDYSPGRFAWMTRGLRRLREPVAHRGAQGLRDLPPEVERLVLAEIES